MSRFLRCALGFVPIVAALGILGGCGGEADTKTAEFPKVEKTQAPVAIKAAPSKSTGRVGSEQGVPNP